MVAGARVIAEALREGDSVAGTSEVAMPCGCAGFDEEGAVSSVELPREEDTVAGASAAVAS